MSNTIYNEKIESKLNNYVYLITEISTNKKYIGVRSCDIPILEDLGKIYFSSSTNDNFILNQKENIDNYKYEVLSNYSSRKEANLEEIRLHELYNVDVNDEFYNKVKANSKGFDPTNKAVVKDKNGKIFQVSVNDPRYLSGELVHIDKNIAMVKDENGKILKVSVNNPRYLSGELVGHTKGRVPVKDKDGNMFLVDNDDPRYLSGELVHNMVGKTLSEECKKKISDKVSGNKNGFYGKNHSEEVLNKVSNIYLIEGIQYRGREEVAKKYGINIRTVANRCKSELFTEWKLIKKRL